MTYTVLSTEQSLFDVAIIVYGDVEGVHALLDDNPGVGLTDRLQKGQQLIVQPEAINPQMAEYLTDFTTPQTIREEDRPQGIDYWLFDEYVVQ